MTGGKMRLEISDILDPIVVQAMLNTFSKKLKSNNIEIALAILNCHADPIVYEINFTKFCNQVRKTTAGEHQCCQSDRLLIDMVNQNFIKGITNPVYFRCKLGLVDFCIPLIIDNEIIAYFFGGQIRINKGCTYNGSVIESLQSPDFSSLIKELNEKALDTSTVEYIESLKNSFNCMRVIEKDEFENLTQVVIKMAEDLNSLIRELAESRHVAMEHEFMEEIKNVKSSNELFELIVDRLPKIMQTKYCSIFLVHKTCKDGNEKLVLVKTNYRNINSTPYKQKLEENTSYYTINEKDKHLTAWVWANGKALVLNDINNQAELKAYGITRFEGKYNDSDEHKGFLAVPVKGSRGQVIGVIRMPHKIRRKQREISFTNHDVILLEFLTNHLAPVIELQDWVDYSNSCKGLINFANELNHSNSYKEVIGLIIQNAIIQFGGRNGIRIFLNRYIPGSAYWTLYKSAGDLELDQKWEGRKFFINEGLTGKIIQDKKQILLHDLEKAKIEQNYIEAVSGESAMAAPLMYKGKVFGVLGIVSNQKFVFSEKDLDILNIITRIGSDALIRTRFFHVKEFLKWLLQLLPDIAKRLIF